MAKETYIIKHKDGLIFIDSCSTIYTLVFTTSLNRAIKFNETNKEMATGYLKHDIAKDYNLVEVTTMFKEKINKHKSVIDNANECIEATLLHADPSLDEDHILGHLKVGFWDCELSPVGLCVYNKVRDRALDGCIYCSQPHERK